MSRRLAGALVGGAALAVYLATLSHWYSADSLIFAVEVDAEEWRRRLDPYHFFLHPLCWLWVKAWLLAGWSGKSIVPLQVLNAAGAALSVTLLFLLVAEASGSRSAALLSAAGFAFSGGMWMFATEAEDVALALPAYVALGALLLRLEPGGPRRPASVFLLGLAIGLAALVYLTLAFLLVAAMVVILESRGRRARRATYLWLGFLAPTVPAAVLTTHLEVGLEAWPRMFALHGGGSMYGGLSWESLPRGVYALLRSMVVFPGLGINDSTAALWARAGAVEHAALVATYLGLAVIFALPLGMALRDWSSWNPARRRRAIAWVAPFAAFALYWVPSDQEFWLPVAVGWFALGGLLVARGAISHLAAALVVVALFVANALCVILPHHDAARNTLTDATMSLAARSSAADVFVVSPSLRLYLFYFAERHAVAVAPGGDVDAAIQRARSWAAERSGRVIVFAVPFEATSRDRWGAAPAFDILGEPVWQVP